MAGLLEMAFPLLATLELSSWTVGELQTSAKGQKAAPVFCKQSPSPTFQLTTVDKPCLAPFGCNAYGDADGKATRRNLELDISEEHATKLSELDVWAEGEAARLGLKGEYKPLCFPSKMGQPRLRCKVTCTGPSAARWWSTLREPLPSPMTQDYAGASIVPVVAVTKLWSMGGMHGLTAELRHALVDLAGTEAPDFS